MAVPTADPTAPDPPGSTVSQAPRDPRSRGWAELLARAVGAFGGGLLLYYSFPPRTLWWLAMPALALLGVAVHGRRARAGFGYGFLFGMGFLLPLLTWIGALVGPVPWVALVVLESLFVGLAGAGMALVSRLPAAPVWAAAVWCAGESLRGRVPFGGLPWGRVGFGQPAGPLLPVASIGGVPLLSFVTVLTGLALGELVRRLVVHRSEAPRSRARSLLVPAVLGVVAMLTGPLAALVPATGGGPAKSVTIAAVQGNVPRMGLDFNSQRRAVLDDHVAETIKLADEVAAGTVPKPDIVIWPENSSDIDPLQNPDAAAQIDRAAQAVGVPILVGAVLQNPDGVTTSNSALVWLAGQGVVERADKRRVQPFGEYMPWRSFFAHFSSYVARAGYFVPGNGPGVVQMAGVDVGVTICWEVAFDDLVEDSVNNGAQVLAVPSNNATFGFTEMTYQQLAMSQVRSVEHDRASVVATTSGVSAMIAPDGTVTQSTKQFTPAVLVERTPLLDTTTLATRLASTPEWVLVALAVVAVGAVVVTRRRQKRLRGKDEDG
ncbi:apolipoprotein N-acyltransferase [Pseudonocardia sp.]|uniref:apolipoprotein N-acyltransferase n=1 Tax=Pseudonocardia sp. TaxID=60912 RepID=UPI0026178D83|nr:apolipoprotein N-acyltransferase [Pseudonocardia sp.]MCW2721561.1 Apolipoprotein N-acyltransferase [Pseudonocardia sp.]MDT7618344.1 apolipoprotein N-acyltransferase [Pseudonocardiales bacterium]